MAPRKIAMDERTHGLPKTYQAGCRCEECKAAQSAYAKQRAEARKAGEGRKRGERAHGTRARYSTDGCRCEPCKAAEAAYQRDVRAKRFGRTSKVREHGVRSTYQSGCRCEDCIAAQTAYNAGLRKKAADARPADDVVEELRIPVSCPHCGSGVVQQTASAVTGSGLRVTVMLRCTKPRCNRQWQFIGTLISMSGAEYQGAVA